MTKQGTKAAGPSAAKPRPTPESLRVAALLARDAAGRAEEARRQKANDELKSGHYANIEDTRIGPTPEQLARAAYEPFTAEKAPGTVRVVETVRRVSVNRVKQLYDRGVLTDDLYPACLWYQRAYEGSGLGVTSAAANWTDAPRGQPNYGHGARTPAQIEARANFRFAREGMASALVPADAAMLDLFDSVVLAEWSLERAARTFRCRETTAAKRLLAVAWRLRGRIDHLLPVRAVGAPGSGPAGAAGVGRRAAAEARAAAPEAGPTDIDPAFLDEHGLMRPWEEIRAVILGRMVGEV